MQSRKPGEGSGRPHGRKGRGDAAREVAHRLAGAARRAGYEWWWTVAWLALREERHDDPLVVALGGLADALRSGHDPDVVAGGERAARAVEVAGEWLGAGVGPGDVGGWLAAGCWRPTAARALIDAGIRPAQLLYDEGGPRHFVDSVSGRRIPLARAVADDEMSAHAAMTYLRGLDDTRRARVERGDRAWRVAVPIGDESDEVAEGRAANLGEVDAVARALVAEHTGEDPHEVYLTVDVQLPAAIRQRLDRADQLRHEGEHRASDPVVRRSALDVAAAELRAAARELAELGVTVADMAELLQVTTREAHDLLRDPFPRSRLRSPRGRRTERDDPAGEEG